MASFIEEAIGDADLRIDHEFGHGFVRLKASEAEKRQAAQDIRASEDIVIEMLRNARDAGARNIFIATQREGDERSIVILDDGCGIPEELEEIIFEPRVTSKLDSASLDRWGLHGRGMALYSIKVNSLEARVVASGEGRGASIMVRTALATLPEKKDQSTFPSLEMADGRLVMRGPKNIMRTAAEFALEHKDDLDVRYGSPTEIAAALYEYGMATCTPASRAFRGNLEDVRLIQSLAFATAPEDLAELACAIGLPMSDRSARRIMDGGIPPAPTLMDRIRTESLPSPHRQEGKGRAPKARKAKAKRTRIARDDLDALAGKVGLAYAELAEAYFLDADVDICVKPAEGVLRIDIPMVPR